MLSVMSRMRISAPRDLETLVCTRGAKLSLKSLSKRLDSPRRGSRGFIYDLWILAGLAVAGLDLGSLRRQCDFTG